MAGEGQMLRAAREEKQWSLAYTEDITKIRIRYIQALEQEEYEILPGETYTKGYLRTYAKQLGLNPNEILALYNSSVAHEPAPVIESPNVPVRVRPFWVKPVLLGSISVVIIVLVVAFALSKPGNEYDSSHVTVVPSAPQTEDTASSSSTPQTEDTAPSSSKPQTEDTVPSSSKPVVLDPAGDVITEDDLTMKMVFSEDCWMEIKIDERPSFQKLFRAGTTEEIKGKSKIELVSIGHAEGFSATLNGKKLPSYADGGNVVNNVVITQDTLKTL